MEAALRAIEAREAEADEVRRQVELALEQARYEVIRAHRQYDAVDPDNRLVAAELERRWNDTLLAVRQLEDRLVVMDTRRAPPMTPEERARLMTLGSDLERAWHHPGATPETRKRILRTVLAEIVARVEGDEITLVLHWQGGDHTRLTVPKNRPGRHRWTTEASTEQLIRELSNFAARPGDRLDPEPCRQAHRPRQHLDRSAGFAPSGATTELLYAGTVNGPSVVNSL